MDLQNRCPECGQRLKTNYCDICMRKVPFGGVKQPTYRDPWDMKTGSSAHRMERGHECISFEKEEKKPFRRPAPKQTAASPKKILQKIAIFIAVLSLVPTLFGVLEEMSGADSIAVPEPAANIHDGFVAAGDPGAENVPKVTPGEIYNENGVRITVDAAGLSYGEYSIFLTICNETDHNITVNGDLFSVNGYMYPYGLYHEVKQGRTEQTYLCFYSSELEKYGIEQVGDIEFILDIYDEYNYESTRTPIAIKTDYTVNYSAMTGISSMPLYSDENLTVILQDAMLDGSGDCKLNLYMQNHSQNTLNVYSGAIWVNGEEVSGYLWQMLRPNTCAMSDMYIYEPDERTDSDIHALDEIKEITVDLYIERQDGLELVELISETITFEPGAIQS